MIRVKDHTSSLEFYQKTMGGYSSPPPPPLTITHHHTGMTLFYTLELPPAGFNLYYLGYHPSPTTTPSPLSCDIPFHEGLLGLTWTYGTEKDPDFSYHNGNTEPQGFGHICVAVDDLDGACTRFEGKKEVRWKKRLTEGRMKSVAFLLDPDGYWIEVRFLLLLSFFLSIFLLLLLLRRRPLLFSLLFFGYLPYLPSFLIPSP